jgi:molybdate transport system substrate-binding protein
MILLVGCTASPSVTTADTITVFAAASLTDAFNEIGATFEAAHPDVTVTFNFAGSQQLAQQLVQGAPGDLFASANPRQMAVVVENGRIAADAPQSFTSNQLVVIFPADNPGQIKQLADLARPGLKLILAAKAVPVGAYSLAFLQRASQEDALGSDFATAVTNNVVSYEQNVRAVFSKVALGEADGGIVYTSDVVSMADSRVEQLAIPPEWNIAAEYPIAPLNDTPHPEQARQFIDFVLSNPGQQILQKYGFLSPLP